MAKTFKNLPRSGELLIPKPTSERDFFDLSDEKEMVKKPAERPQSKDNTSVTDNTSNISNTSNNGKKDVLVVSDLASENNHLAALADGVRQTFVLSRGHLEQLRDYVHARRTQGEYTYSQKQALQEALDLLFASATPAPPRPAHTREQEQQRRQRIQRGRRSEASE